MTNVADAAIGALAGGSPWAPIVAAVCGIATAAGPCAAPRVVALSTLTARGARCGKVACAAAFVVGLCICYATLGYLAASAGRVPSASSLAYDLTALGLCVAGVYALLVDRRASKASTSAGFALGALCASAVSPCCTALIVPIVVAAAAAGQPAHAALLMACYSFGHVIPASATAIWARMRKTSGSASVFLSALRTVAAAVTLATGLYCAVLA